MCQWIYEKLSCHSMFEHSWNGKWKIHEDISIKIQTRKKYEQYYPNMFWLNDKCIPTIKCRGKTRGRLGRCEGENEETNEQVEDVLSVIMWLPLLHNLAQPASLNCNGRSGEKQSMSIRNIHTIEIVFCKRQSRVTEKKEPSETMK